MLKFFDYVYYKCCQFYYKNGEENGYKISGLALLSLFQLLNIALIIILVFQWFHYWANINKMLFAIPVFILLLLNGFRYNKLNYDVLKEKWENESATTSKKREVGVLLYMVLSVILVIAVIIWRLNTK